MERPTEEEKLQLEIDHREKWARRKSKRKEEDYEYWSNRKMQPYERKRSQKLEW